MLILWVNALQITRIMIQYIAAFSCMFAAIRISYWSANSQKGVRYVRFLLFALALDTAIGATVILMFIAGYPAVADISTRQIVFSIANSITALAAIRLALYMAGLTTNGHT